MPLSGASSPHQPVLYHQVLEALQAKSDGRYIDATVGAGGHAAGILQASSPSGQLLGLDVDPVALQLAGKHLAQFGERAILRRASYTTLLEQMELLDWKHVNGILFDLGLSSMQLDMQEKGFSFRKEGSLDMRFNPEQSLTAAELVNTLPYESLVDILWRFGEERFSRRIARAIIRSRPIQTTTDLAALVVKAVGRTEGPTHPATRTFQALRIAVNQELTSIQSVLPDIVTALQSGGRVAIISFHSLEDRIIKQFFQRETQDCICPPHQPICTCEHKASLKIVKRLAKPTEEEIKNNPRARSAKLRVAEKI